MWDWARRSTMYAMRYHSLATLLAFGLALAVVGCGGGGGGGGSDFEEGGFVGRVLSDNENFNIEVNSVIIGQDRRPEVTFNATDDDGFLIPLREFTDARFMLASLKRPSVGAAFQYKSYTNSTETAAGGAEAKQDGYDSAGLGDLKENADGSLSFKFNSRLPRNYDPTATHQLGGQLRYERENNQGEMVVHRANVIVRFRPDGNPASERRDIVSTASCNQCHTRLSVHGDVRREVQLCIMCHNTWSSDAETGNSLQFADMIHKIHEGANLPSFVIDGEPYQISGFRDTLHDYSHVEFPQDSRNCTVCHSNASQANIHQTAPTLEGCASCHDRTWFGPVDDTPTSFTNHLGGVQADNSLCALCHSPQGNGVSLVSVAHQIPQKSSTAPGLELNVVDVETFPGATETAVRITFTADNADGSPIDDLSVLNTVATTLAYPASDYETYVREVIYSGSGPAASLVNLGSGVYEYTFSAEVPSASTDTFAVAMEGRRDFVFRDETFRQGTSTNGQAFFTLDASIPESRREVVDNAKCSVCHDEIRAHGDLRVGVNYCVMCHNPNTTDENRRPAGELPPVTVNFKEMIHKIHAGADLDKDYTVYGFGGTPHNYNETVFPGLRQECAICHEDGTQTIPLPSEVISTVVTQDAGATFVSEVFPTRAACNSCHDTDAADTHAQLQTSGSSESCAVCHSNGDDLSVANVHRLGP